MSKVWIKNMKYIITNHNRLIIGTGTNHRDLASGVSGNVVSAGEIEIKNGKIRVFGESFGYRIKSKLEDAEFISKVMGGLQIISSAVQCFYK